MSKITAETIDVPRTVIDRRKVYTLQLTEQEMYFLRCVVQKGAYEYGSDRERTTKLLKLLPDLTNSVTLGEAYVPDAMFNKE